MEISKRLAKKRLAKKGLAGRDRGELVIGVVCARIACSALALCFVTPGEDVAGATFPRSAAQRREWWGRCGSDITAEASESRGPWS